MCIGIRGTPHQQVDWSILVGCPTGDLPILRHIHRECPATYSMTQLHVHSCHRFTIARRSGDAGWIWTACRWESKAGILTWKVLSFDLGLSAKANYPPVPSEEVLRTCDGCLVTWVGPHSSILPILQPNSDGLQPKSDGLQPRSDGRWPPT